MPCSLNKVIIALLHLTPLFLSLWQWWLHGSLCLSALCISVRHHLSSCLYISLFGSMHFSVSVAGHHFLFFSVPEESHFVSISLSQLQLLSLSLFPLYYLSFSPSIFLRILCHAHFSTFPPCCSIVALTVPLLIYHLLLSTDLFAKNKLLQLRDRKIAKFIGICDGWGDGGW